MSNVTIFIDSRSHANMESLPLRFGVHLASSQRIDLFNVSNRYEDPRNRSRFHVDADFIAESDRKHHGHFVLESAPGQPFPRLVTVWRDDADTEMYLSETVKSLCKEGYLTVKDLLDMHPLYRDGKVNTSPGLLKYMSSLVSADVTAKLTVAVDSANEAARQYLAERNAAQELASKKEQEAEKSRAVALEAIDTVEFLEKEVARMKAEQTKARASGSELSVAPPDVLKQVNENVVFKGKSCTELVLGDNTKKYMVTNVFDKDGSITAMAKTLQARGARVRTTCWDPLDRPMLYTRMGYFRNIYAVGI